VEAAERFMSTPVTGYEEFEEFRGRKFLFAAGHFDYFSGAEKQAVYFSGELVKHLQADVKFIGWGGDGRFANEVRKVGAVPVVFPLDPGGSGWSHRLQLFRLARFIRRELQPEFLLPYVWMHCKIIGSIWEWTGARFCWWNQRDEGRGIEGTLLERRLLKTLPAVVSNSWEGRDFLQNKFDLPSGRVQVINNGVKLPEIRRDQQFRRTMNIPKDACVIAMLANLTCYKDHETLVRAFAQVTRVCRRSDVHLFIAGSFGETTNQIKSLAWDLQLAGRLHFTGSLDDVEPLLRATDIVVHSSKTEGCPNGALEAMAHGLCVLGTDISGLRQALGETASTSCLSPLGDVEHLAGKILERLQSPELLLSEGQRNRRRIETEFAIPLMVRKSLHVIRNASRGR
jgi:glycosyltransferase involved in cell wall biosynthesis